jgi:DNA primase small subunit
MLQNDFGFAEHEIHTYFSGHRGYHIHVENEAVQSLDTMGRKEIVDYVCGIGLELFSKDRKEPAKAKRKEAAPGFSLGDFGWKRRLKMGMRGFIQTASAEDLFALGLTKRTVGVIQRNRDVIISRCVDGNRWGSVKGVCVETWTKIAEHLKNQQIAQFDTVVTSDIHRLIRANGTLHGKTGLLKVEFPVKELDTFDPFVGAVAFKEGAAKVVVKEAPLFRLSGETFGPFKDATVELPTAAAVLLILKGRAQVTT